MPGNSLNFSRWLQRLGFKDQRQPEIIRAVQPVQVVGDVSYLVSPLVPPSGLVGGRRAGVAAVYGTFEAYGGTRGGVTGRLLTSVVSATRVAYRLSSTEITVGNTIAAVIHEYTAGRTCNFTIGTAALLVDGLNPEELIPNNGTAEVIFYCPPGQWFYASGAGVNQNVSFQCEWQEYEAAPGAE